MANHVIVNLDRIQAVKTGNIESVVANIDLDNGSFVHLGGLVNGERELRQAVVPTTATITTDEVVLVASPELDYLPGKGLKDFYIPAGTPARAYHLEVGDIFTITDDGITGTPQVGKYVVPQNGSVKLAVANDLTGGTRFAGKIIEKTYLGFDRISASVIQVVKA